MGATIEPVELAIILDRPLMTIWAMLDSAVSRGVLRHTGDEFAFRDRAQRAMFAERLAAPDRSRMPLDAARRLIPAGIPDQRIARYLLEAGAPFDRDLLEWIVTVAAVLTFQDPHLAARLLTRACAVGTPDDDIVEELGVWRVRALMRCGRVVAAVRVVRSALEHPRVPNSHRDGAADMVWLCAYLEFVQGRLAEAMDTIDKAADRLDLRLAARGRLSGLAALILLARRRVTDAETAAAEAIMIGASEGEPTATAFGRRVLGMIRYQQGLLGEAIELGNDVADEHRRRSFTVERRPPAFDLFELRALCLLEVGRSAEAADALDRSVEVGRAEPGIDPLSAWRVRARLRFLVGDWDAVVQNRTEPPSTESVDDPTMRGWSTLIEVNRGIIAADSSEHDADAGDVSDIGERQFLWSWARALADDAAGRSADAIARLVELCVDPAGGATVAMRYYLYPDLARIAATAGNPEIPARVALLAEQWDSRYSTAARRGTAFLCRGLADSAPSLIESAESEFRAAGRPLYVGQACENLAALLGASGRREEARAALYRAVDQYSALGATTSILRADARLRQFGIRRGRHRPSGQGSIGQPALSPAETRVAELLVVGFSNSEIAARTNLSEHTIESHVSTILAKLGAHSRVQLAANAEGGLWSSRRE